jgi:hypothetical protein
MAHMRHLVANCKSSKTACAPAADRPERFEEYADGPSQLQSEGELILMRCNGPHGAFNDYFDPTHPHFDFHVHRASAAMTEAGLRAEKSATVSRDLRHTKRRYSIS